MAVKWQEPKTNWAIFNADQSYQTFNIDPDYNRITGNIEFLKEYLSNLRPPGAFTSLVSQTIVDVPTAAVFNAIEAALTELHAQYAYDSINWERKEWTPNFAAPNYEDLNRWESLLLAIHKKATAQVATIPTIEFTLGGVQF